MRKITIGVIAAAVFVLALVFHNELKNVNEYMRVSVISYMQTPIERAAVGTLEDANFELSTQLVEMYNNNLDLRTKLGEEQVKSMLAQKDLDFAIAELQATQLLFVSKEATLTETMNRLMVVQVELSATSKRLAKTEQKLVKAIVPESTLTSAVVGRSKAIWSKLAFWR